MVWSEKSKKLHPIPQGARIDRKKNKDFWEKATRGWDFDFETGKISEPWGDFEDHELEPYWESRGRGGNKIPNSPYDQRELSPSHYAAKIGRDNMIHKGQVFNKDLGRMEDISIGEEYEDLSLIHI